ncbi:MAG: DedA family protein [Cytophagales bacterium]|nr:DedA family protein [Armatimonadota bacterium]
MGTPNLADFFRHLNDWFVSAIAHYGTGIYAILFGIVFCETGLVFLPFLPGDSLLFTAGAFSGPDSNGSTTGRLSLPLLYVLFFSAALIGDNVNYSVGRFFGRKLFRNEKSRVFNRRNLHKTEQFFEKYGTKAIVLARFVPIVRTFSPFVAGMGDMPYSKFLTFSVLGAALWVGVCVTAGHFFGSLPFVKKNFEVVVLGIIAVSVVPMIVEILNHRRSSPKAASATTDRER